MEKHLNARRNRLILCHAGRPVERSNRVSLSVQYALAGAIGCCASEIMRSVQRHFPTMLMNKLDPQNKENEAQPKEPE